jgi:hypothetical protein
VKKFPLLRAQQQLAQLQFHCGTPPPAAEPRILICTAKIETGSALGATFFAGRSLFAGVHVGRDFHAQADFFKFRFDPGHIFILVLCLNNSNWPAPFFKKNFGRRPVLCPPRIPMTTRTE